MWSNRCLDDSAVLLEAHQQTNLACLDISPTDPLRLSAALHLAVVFTDRLGDSQRGRAVLQDAIDMARLWPYRPQPDSLASNWLEMLQSNLDLLSNDSEPGTEPGIVANTTE
jgi:hypothetical protein